jgi:hypothetical protein
MIMRDLEALIGSDRAEDLTPEEVLSLFVGAAGDEVLVTNLMKSGVHLLQGSRGTGKTMLMRVAYERLRRPPQIGHLPVWVSFSRYLATYNPAARRNAAYSPFQSWVFAKLLKAMRDAAQLQRPDLRELPTLFGPIPADAYLERLETHYRDPGVSDPRRTAEALGISEQALFEFAGLDQLQSKVLSFLEQNGFTSVAFFLDEAAQSFAEDLQPEFFQLIRHLRHYRISVNAAVYPNITNYGRDFDVGQDAITLPIERQIETADGMALLQELVKKRFTGTALGTSLERSPVQTDFLIKMSGGNPRWFLHLLNRLSCNGGDIVTSSQSLAVAKEFPDSTLWPYLRKIGSNLASKRKYVETAFQLSQLFLESLREANKSVRRETPERPMCYVAVSTHKTVPFRIHAALRLLQYAGIVAARGPKKITARESAEMYLLHPAILVRENALYAGETNPPVDAIVKALTDPQRERFREFTRNSPRFQDFRQAEEADALTCSHCNALVAEGSRFCPSCGQPFTTTSPYEELLQQPASELELTPRIKQRLLDDGRFKTVGDIEGATDDDLDAIPWIGKARIPLIRYAVEEFLAG